MIKEKRKFWIDTRAVLVEEVKFRIIRCTEDVCVCEWETRNSHESFV